ncbi:MAG TPA: metal ABC transporter ATP-binding protein [Elusimicrobiota bacterium]|nr:metal ABC transporter ATP-binding protein [Elusimicrobiota bacterium]
MPLETPPPAVNHGENLIELDHVSFSYGGRPVLEDVELAVHRGDYLGIVGGNGAGKTTLIKIVLGLLRPTSGAVRLFGQDISAFKDWSRLGYVPQKATNFDANFPATVEEVALMGRYGRRGLLRFLTRDDKEETRRALEQVGLWQERGRLIGDLSGGQQQRVFIARALAGGPEALILDEPTVGVERGVAGEFYALLKRLNEELRLTVVLVTHDIDRMAHQAMHVACVDKTLFYHRSVDEYFRKTHVEAHPHDHPAISPQGER